jgi:2-polyprenyl-6-hydroxyphenyl methylase/3-demethylubiquinone-9 3-methyltransferase
MNHTPAAPVDYGSTNAPSDAFRFGKNWQRYVADYLDPERVRIAAESLREMVPVDLAGKTFLDIGCGSGLFSLCAHNAGATVVSLDVDPDAVAATKYLRAQAGDPDTWEVIHRSILDPAITRDLQPADVVYSWGVLHHTGDMDRAIENAAKLVAPGGVFCIAIYNRVIGRFLDSERWLKIKRTYNHVPRPAQVAMEQIYVAYWALGHLRSRSNPLAVAREYKTSRGMALRTDLIDWLGGYPYEFATVREIKHFCEQRCGMTLEHVKPIAVNGTGNNEFVFRRPITPP